MWQETNVQGIDVLLAAVIFFSYLIFAPLYYKLFKFNIWIGRALFGKQRGSLLVNPKRESPAIKNVLRLSSKVF